MEQPLKFFSFNKDFHKTLTLSTAMAFTLLCFEGHSCLSDSTYFPPEFEAKLDDPAPAEKEKSTKKTNASKKEKFKTLLQAIDNIPSKSSNDDSKEESVKTVAETPLPKEKASPQINKDTSSSQDSLASNPSEDDLTEVAPLSKETHSSNIKEKTPLTLTTPSPSPQKEEKPEALAHEVNILEEEPLTKEMHPSNLKDEAPVALVDAEVPATKIPETTPPQDEKGPEKIAAEIPAPIIPTPESTPQEEKLLETAEVPATEIPEIAPSQDEGPEKIAAETPAPVIPTPELLPQEEKLPEMAEIPATEVPETTPHQDEGPEKVAAIVPAPVIPTPEFLPQEEKLPEIAEVPTPEVPETTPLQDKLPQEGVTEMPVPATPAPESLPQETKLPEAAEVPAAIEPEIQSLPKKEISSEKPPVSLVPSTAPEKTQPLPPKDVSTPQKHAPLQKVNVVPHPEAKPLAEEKPVEAQQTIAPADEVVSDTSLFKDRTPIALLEPNQNPSSLQWVLYSSVKRGLKSPSDVVDIVCFFGKNGISPRGEEVKAILVSKGIKPNRIQLIHANGEENQTGQVLVFIEQKKQ
jgi:hypothetical protein